MSYFKKKITRDIKNNENYIITLCGLMLEEGKNFMIYYLGDRLKTYAFYYKFKMLKRIY